MGDTNKDKKDQKPDETKSAPTAEDFAALETRVKAAEDKAKNAEVAQKAGFFSVAEDGTVNPGSNYSQPRSNSDEQKALRYFGCASAKQLMHVNTEEDRYKWVPGEIKGMVRQLKYDLQTARFIGQLFYDRKTDFIGKNESMDHFPKITGMLESKFAKEILIPKLKAFSTTINADWIPTEVASMYIPEFELDRELIGKMKQVTMPTSPYHLPTAGSFTKARRGTEGQTATESSFATDKLEFIARKFLEYYVIPEETNEDTAPDIVGLARNELTQAHMRAFESTALNGTLIGTAHIDADTQAGAADLAEKNFHGLRYYALQNSANGGTADALNAVLSDAFLRKMRAQMKNLGVNPLDCMWIVGAVGYLQMLGTEDVVTIDKLGSAATILKGQLGSYQGIPIVQSGFLRDDLNATGVNDGVTTDRTGLLMIHRNRWYWATRRPIRLALRPSRSADDQFEMASYSRVDFKGHPQSASEVGVVYGYNIALS